MRGKRILVTGGSGTVGRPMAESLAADNEVWCLGRFGDPEVRAALEAKGARILPWDLGVSGLDGLPGGFTHVFHAGVIRDSDSQETHIEKHAFATAQLMQHCRDAESFIFISASSVYRRQDPSHRYAESDLVGDNGPTLDSYAMHKNGAEAVVRGLSRLYGLPSVIARLSVTYGPYGNGGVPGIFFGMMLAGMTIPTRADPAETLCNPLHVDDVVRQVPGLWEAASVPALTVNWAGDEAVTQRQIADYITELTGVEARFEPQPGARISGALDSARRRELLGDCQVDWRTGVRRTLSTLFPQYADRIAAAS